MRPFRLLLGRAAGQHVAAARASPAVFVTCVSGASRTLSWNTSFSHDVTSPVWTAITYTFDASLRGKWTEQTGEETRGAENVISDLGTIRRPFTLAGAITAWNVITRELTILGYTLRLAPPFHSGARTRPSHRGGWLPGVEYRGNGRDAPPADIVPGALTARPYPPTASVPRRPHPSNTELAPRSTCRCGAANRRVPGAARTCTGDGRLVNRDPANPGVRSRGRPGCRRTAGRQTADAVLESISPKGCPPEVRTERRVTDAVAKPVRVLTKG